MLKERSRPDSLRKMAGTANLLTGCAIMANSSFCLGKSNKKMGELGDKYKFCTRISNKKRNMFCLQPHLH